MPSSNREPLKCGFLIQGYRIDEMIGSGGFSIVYLADNLKNRTKVVIKEYCPVELVTRLTGGRLVPNSEKNRGTYHLGLKRFYAEAIALAKLDHPNIIHVSNFFRENNTVYLVMNYEEGRDLRWFIKRSRGRLGEKFLHTVFPQVSMGLRGLHQLGFLHLDIKPANILLRSGGKALLLDFGAVQKMTSNRRYGGVQTMTHGFAPLEQYEHGRMGPWSDIYALGATMWACIAGKPPPSAPDLKKQPKGIHISRLVARRYSPGLLKSIEWAMQGNYAERPRTVDDFVDTAFQESPQGTGDAWKDSGFFD